MWKRLFCHCYFDFIAFFASCRGGDTPGFALPLAVLVTTVYESVFTFHFPHVADICFVLEMISVLFFVYSPEIISIPILLSFCKYFIILVLFHETGSVIPS